MKNYQKKKSFLQESKNKFFSPFQKAYGLSLMLHNLETIWKDSEEKN
jgi:hypothetical protein